MTEVARIHETVTMLDVCKRYGIEVNDRGFALCPFHQERTPSLKIYPGDRGFHCFGCGAHGDVISFVQKYFGQSFKDAVARINTDFGLVLPSSSRPSILDIQRAGREEYERKKAIRRKKEAAEKAEADYWKCYDSVLALEDFVKDPNNADDALFPRAVALLSKYREELDYADLRRRAAHAE